MKLGCCTSIENAQIVHDAGFDYIECGLVSLAAEEEEAAFAPIRAAYESAPVPTPVFNLFLPGDLKVTGPAVDWARAQRYVARALPRARSLGAQVLVLGSGRSRTIPDGFARSDAWAQLVRFLHMVADVAEQEGITIAIEPLNRRESNVINSVAEGVELAQQVNRPAIRVLADFYHMDEEREPLSHLVQYSDWLAHVHVADSDRRAPGTGAYPYAEFVENLRAAEYKGMISVECRWEDLAKEAEPAVRFLRDVAGG